jgi:DNA-binding NarL/FixJ family response regulator
MPETPFLVLEDDLPVARALARSLRSYGPVLIAATVTEAVQHLDAVPRWTAFLLDVWLPDGNGLEVLARARERHPLTPAMVLTGFLDDQIAATSYDLRAIVLPKPYTADRLAFFVKLATSSSPTVDEFAEAFAHQHAIPPAELDVLRRLLAGDTVECIAAARGTSVLTVRKQIANLRSRAGAESLFALAIAMFRTCLSEPSARLALAPEA